MQLTVLNRVRDVAILQADRARGEEGHLTRLDSQLSGFKAARNYPSSGPFSCEMMGNSQSKSLDGQTGSSLLVHIEESR